MASREIIINGYGYELSSYRFTASNGLLVEIKANADEKDVLMSDYLNDKLLHKITLHDKRYITDGGYEELIGVTTGAISLEYHNLEHPQL